MKRSRKASAVLTLLVITIIACCVSSTYYLMVGKDVQFQGCLDRIAIKLGAEPTFAAVFEAVRELVPAGSTQDETRMALEQVTAVTLIDSQRLAGTYDIRETIRLDFCPYSFNIMVIHAMYSPDGKLIGLFSVED